MREQAQITQLAALPRSQVSKVSLLLIGTEHSALLIVDPQSYSAIMTVSISLTDASAANAEPMWRDERQWWAMMTKIGSSKEGLLG